MRDWTIVSFTLTTWNARTPKGQGSLYRPFAPMANVKRLADPYTVETFLKLNGTLVFKRECTTLEKGDVIT